MLLQIALLPISLMKQIIILHKRPFSDFMIEGRVLGLLKLVLFYTVSFLLSSVFSNI